MSFAELKDQIAELSPEERFKLSAFLVDLELEKESEFRSEVDRRMKAMDSGAKVHQEQFEERHRRGTDEAR